MRKGSNPLDSLWHLNQRKKETLAGTGPILLRNLQPRLTATRSKTTSAPRRDVPVPDFREASALSSREIVAGTANPSGFPPNIKTCQVSPPKQERKRSPSKSQEKNSPGVEGGIAFIAAFAGFFCLSARRTGRTPPAAPSSRGTCWRGCPGPEPFSFTLIGGLEPNRWLGGEMAVAQKSGTKMTPWQMEPKTTCVTVAFFNFEPYPRGLSHLPRTRTRDPFKSQTKPEPWSSQETEPPSPFHMEPDRGVPLNPWKGKWPKPVTRQTGSVFIGGRVPTHPSFSHQLVVWSPPVCWAKTPSTL